MISFIVFDILYNYFNVFMHQSFSRLDFTEIDDFDPSLAEGHRVLYDRVIPTYIRYQDKYTEWKDMPNPE